MNITVPFGSNALVYVPSTSKDAIKESNKSIEENDFVTFLKAEFLKLRVENIAFLWRNSRALVGGSLKNQLT